MLRVLIVDDEPLARRGLARLLAAHPGVTLAGEAADLATAARQIAALRPDAVFLDIELDETGDGFDLIARLEQPPRIVFVTAHARHAVEAFSVEAVDFLLKPVSPERLAATLRRLERLVAGQAAGRAEAAVLELRASGRSLFVRHDDIVALRADGDFTHVSLAGQAPVMVLRSLSAFEAQLPLPPFLRLGRSLIVNLNRLAALERTAGGEVRLRLGGLPDPLPLSRAGARRLRQALGQAQGHPKPRSAGPDDREA